MQRVCQLLWESIHEPLTPGHMTQLAVGSAGYVTERVGDGNSNTGLMTPVVNRAPTQTEGHRGGWCPQVDSPILVHPIHASIV